MLCEPRILLAPAMTDAAFAPETIGLAATPIDALPVMAVGPGCTRRDLPQVAGVRAWIVDMAPGALWPHVDEHPAGEAYVVLHGEVIEGDERFGAGTCVTFASGSRHRPRTDTGVRLYGFNPPEPR
jgi:anti-sigma factor ChrR (cupin superfamily)